MTNCGGIIQYYNTWNGDEAKAIRKYEEQLEAFREIGVSFLIHNRINTGREVNYPIVSADQRPPEQWQQDLVAGWLADDEFEHRIFMGMWHHHEKGILRPWNQDDILLMLDYCRPYAGMKLYLDWGGAVRMSERATREDEWAALPDEDKLLSRQDIYWGWRDILSMELDITLGAEPCPVGLEWSGIPRTCLGRWAIKHDVLNWHENDPTICVWWNDNRHRDTAPDNPDIIRKSIANGIVPCFYADQVEWAKQFI